MPMPGADCCPSMDCGTSLGMSCNAGKCGCDAGFADCDPKVPGCETEIGGGDAFNCGACGFSCQGGACSTGVCEPKALSAVVPGDLCIGTVDETYLYGRRADGSITAYDKVTGQAMEVTGPGDTAFCGSGVLPDELAVDGTDLYYMTSDEVRVVPKKGGSPTTFITLAGNSDFPNGGEVGGYGGLVVDATNVYFAGIYGTYAISKSTLAVKMLDASGFRRALLVKNGKLYAGDVMSGIVSVDDVAGGGSNTIASGQNSPWGIFVDDTYVYWTNEADGGGSFFNGSIWSKPLAGGAAKNLTGDVLTQARVVTGDDKDLYFPMNGGIVSMPREGGPTRTLTKTHGDDMLTRLFVEPGFVYFVSSGTPYRLAK